MYFGNLLYMQDIVEATVGGRNLEATTLLFPTKWVSCLARPPKVDSNEFKYGNRSWMNLDTHKKIPAESNNIFLHCRW